jgi:hypothetical protein
LLRIIGGARRIDAAHESLRTIDSLRGADWRLFSASSKGRPAIWRLRASEPCPGDVGAVFLSESADERVAALAVDFAIPVAMTVVEAWLLHFRLLGDHPTGILTDSLGRCCPYVLSLLIAVAMTYDRAILLERAPVAIAAGLRVCARVCAPA